MIKKNAQKTNQKIKKKMKIYKHNIKNKNIMSEISIQILIKDRLFA